LRIRIYNLSKELGVSNKDVLAKCEELGIEAKSHSSTVDETAAGQLRVAFGAEAKEKAAEEAPPAGKKAPEAKPKAKGEAPPKKKKKKAAAEEKEEGKPRRERPRRGKKKAKPETGPNVVGHIELPKQDTSVREYGPRVRVKERREERERGRRRRPPRRRRGGGGRRPSRRRTITAERPSEITLNYPATLRTFSEAAGIKVDALMRTLMSNGVMATINDPLSEEAVELLGSEHDVEVTLKRPRDLEEELRAAGEEADKPEDLKPRPPVVTFLGHVDHGKTSLLDAIRETHVVDTESGGITQHIGAYVVQHDDRRVVFLDTPGHEAFTAMRARGAQVTDIAVLVVAADDGVMPQTEEAINHARAAEVPMVVAINKCDLPSAQPQRVMQQFSAIEILPSTWGGDTEFVQVSAMTKEGLDDLIETLALQAEILELKANPKKGARGHVLEGNLDPGRGSVATLIVREGTLRKGDIVLCGAAYGRARIMVDDRGHPIEEAGPSTPVEIAGLSDVPAAGDPFVVLDDLDKARDVAEQRKRRRREAAVAERHHVTLENLFEQLDQAETKILRVILKADVQGSLEVVRKSLQDLATDEVAVDVLHAAVGGINESDVLLADASDAVIIGFHVVPDHNARALADEEKVDIRLYNVIYHLTDDVKAALESKLEPERREEVRGHAQVRQVFRVSKVGNVAGCYVTDGRIRRNDRVRLIRDSVVVHDGTIGSLRRVKDDVREVPSNMECGINIDGYNDVKEGDVIEGYEVVEIKRTL
jgi:translation initiation factor IF-2